jgi:hypothetical protein
MDAIIEKKIFRNIILKICSNWNANFVFDHCNLGKDMDKDVVFNLKQENDTLKNNLIEMQNQISHIHKLIEEEPIDRKKIIDDYLEQMSLRACFNLLLKKIFSHRK